MNWSRWYRRFATIGPGGWFEWLIFVLLFPCGLVYGLVGLLRAWAYRTGLLKSSRLEVPVISVGNLAAGGTGKTPMVDYLLAWCRTQGIRVAVLSRGYGGRRTTDLLTVCAGSGPLVGPGEAGDEPYLLAQRNQDSVVVVCRDRVSAGREAVERHQAELLILDDGFQHLRLKRDLDLLLMDARLPFGNGRVLPAGYLREFPSALRRADMLALTRSPSAGAIAPPVSVPVVSTRHRLADELVGLNGEKCSLAALAGQVGVAFCGIADPEAFFSQIRECGIELAEAHSLPDHYIYPADFLEKLFQAVENADFFLTTEKDGVKLQQLDSPLPCYQIPLEMEFLEGEEFLLKSLENLLQKDVDAMPLSQDLLEILACPQCKGEVTVNENESEILCEHCQLAYPVRDEIPVMLLDEARSF